MDSELRRDPQRLLEQIEEEERRKKRGRLKIFLGYASGVGKSAKMLAEGLRRRERGEDVVIGAMQPKSSPEIERFLSQHEIIPTQKIAEKDVIDIERILRRHPQVVVIDGLAYSNPQGSRHAERRKEFWSASRHGRTRSQSWKAGGATRIVFMASCSWHTCASPRCLHRTRLHWIRTWRSHGNTARPFRFWRATAILCARSSRLR